MKVKIRKGTVEYGKPPNTKRASVGDEIDLQDTDVERLAARGVVEQVGTKATRKGGDEADKADQ